jgi:hypothetical protein
MYVLVLQGGLAVGSVLWGAVATHTSIRFTLTLAAVLLVAGIGATPVFRLQSSRNN